MIMEHRDHSEYNLNLRATKMISACSDIYACNLAEQIHEQRMAGLPTHHLEQKLDVELTRMFTTTRVMLGQSPYSKNSFKINRDESQ